MDSEHGDGLRWGIRGGFREYLASLVDAETTLDGVQTVPEGYRFPATGDTFSGSLRVTAHGGALDVRLARPAVETSADGHPVLTADIGAERIEIARLLDVPDAATLMASGGTAHDVALTVDGATWLGGVYAPWARMDPVHIDRAPTASDPHPRSA